MPKKGNVKKNVSKQVKKAKQQKGGVPWRLNFFSTKSRYEDGPQQPSPHAPSQPEQAHSQPEQAHSQPEQAHSQPEQAYKIEISLNGLNLTLLESKFRLLGTVIDTPSLSHDSFFDTFLSKKILDYLFEIKSKHNFNKVEYLKPVGKRPLLINKAATKSIHKDNVIKIYEQSENPYKVIDIDNINNSLSLHTFAYTTSNTSSESEQGADDEITYFQYNFTFKFTTDAKHSREDIATLKGQLLDKETTFYKKLRDIIIPEQIDKIDKIVEENKRVGGKKHSKRDVLGKMMVIYKIKGDRKEYVRHKGKLITVKDYKALMKQKAKKESKPKKKKKST